MKTLFLLLVTVSWVPSAMAGGLGSVFHANGCFASWDNAKDCGKDTDRRRRQASVAAADVATLGATRAARKKKEAEYQKSLATQRLSGSEATLADKIRVQTELLNIYTAEKNSALKISGFVTQLVEANTQNVKTIKDLFAAVRNDRAQMLQIQKLLTGQRNQIQAMTNIFLKNDIPEITKMNEVLKGQVATYDAQVRGFPSPDVPQRQVENWFDDLAGTVTNMTITIQQLDVWMKSEVRRADRKLIAAQRVLAQLKGVK